MMNDDELLRYSRHILLSEVDVQGQQRLSDAKVLIAGLGGLGSPVALYLAASGIGHLTLVDFDQVDLSNLQRQVVHIAERVGQSKVCSAQQAISDINASVDVRVVDEQLNASQWSDMVESVDIVVDCTDNFDTRFTLNNACYSKRKPLVSAAAIRFEGQLSVYDHSVDDSPCYQCLYSPDASDDLRCAEAGVISPLVGVMGSLQALEVIKLVVRIGQPLVGRLSLFDAKNGQWREMKLPKDPACPVCSQPR